MSKFFRSRYYFVDEAGTPVIWGRRKKDILIGRHESKYFVMGLTEIRDVTTVSNGIDHLRTMILTSDRFSGIASLAPKRKKTAVQFHAKDDHPLVREEVFKLLCEHYHDIRYYAVVRDKRAVLRSITKRDVNESSRRYHPNDLYDALVRRLFSGRLHQDNCRYTVYFAQRGKSDRQKALIAALQSAQRDYEAFAEVDSVDPLIRFISGYPRQYQGLQVVDYFNWALQRLYERGETEHWRRLWNAGKVRCVVDLDANARFTSGEIYTKANPLVRAPARPSTADSKAKRKS